MNSMRLIEEHLKGAVTAKEIISRALDEATTPQIDSDNIETVIQILRAKPGVLHEISAISLPGKFIRKVSLTGSTITVETYVYFNGKWIENNKGVVPLEKFKSEFIKVAGDQSKTLDAYKHALEVQERKSKPPITKAMTKKLKDHVARLKKIYPKFKGIHSRDFYDGGELAGILIHKGDCSAHIKFNNGGLFAIRFLDRTLMGRMKTSNAGMYDIERILLQFMFDRSYR